MDTFSPEVNFGGFRGGLLQAGGNSGPSVAVNWMKKIQSED